MTNTTRDRCRCMGRRAHITTTTTRIEVAASLSVSSTCSTTRGTPGGWSGRGRIRGVDAEWPAVGAGFRHVIGNVTGGAPRLVRDPRTRPAAPTRSRGPLPPTGATAWCSTCTRSEPVAASSSARRPPVDRGRDPERRRRAVAVDAELDLAAAPPSRGGAACMNRRSGPGGVLQGGDSLGIEALDDEPDAERELEDRDRKCGQPCQGPVLRR